MQTLKPRPAAGRGPRRNRKRPRISRKRLLMAGIAAVLLVTLGRSLLPALGVEAPGLGGQAEETPTEVRTKAPPAPTIDLNGVMVQGGGVPMITLNPGLVRLGGTVTVQGSGFDQGSSVDVYLGPSSSAAQPSGKAKPSKEDVKPVQVGTAKAGKYGVFTVSFPFPNTMSAPVQEVTAQARGSDKV